MPDDRDLLDEVAYLWDGKIQAATAGIASVEGMPEVIIFDFHRI